MVDRKLVLRRIEKLKQSMPTARPLAESAVNDSGKERAEIAHLYLQLGDEDAAASWYLNGARWSHACGDIMGGVVLVKRALKHRRNDAAAGPVRKALGALGPGRHARHNRLTTGVSAGASRVRRSNCRPRRTRSARGRSRPWRLGQGCGAIELALSWRHQSFKASRVMYSNK